MKKAAAFAMLLAVCAALCAIVGRRDSRDERPAEPPGVAEGIAEGIDIDLTRMSQTVRCGYWARLASRPEEFAGKTVRATGFFLTTEDAGDGVRYYACLVADQMGCPCCAPGGVLEFAPKESYKWPDDFPEEESRITVTGRLVIVKHSPSGLGPFEWDVPRLVDAEIAFSR